MRGHFGLRSEILPEPCLPVAPDPCDDHLLYFGFEIGQFHGSWFYYSDYCKGT